MKKIIRVAALGGAVALTLAACGSAPEETEETAGTGDAAASDFKACIVSDAGGFDDKSFNQLSYEGTKKAADELGAEFAEVQSDSSADFPGNLQSLVSESCNTIVSVGFALSADTVESATSNPDISYVLVDDAADNDFDGTKDAENIKPLLYDTAQAAFLAGYLAAGYSEAGKVGTFGGQPYPTVTIFMDGFKQGVEHYNAEKGTNVQVVGYQGGDQGSFTGGFEANDSAKEVAAGIIDQGVDVLLPVGGPIYQSAMDAIADSGREIALIGVDADFFETDPSTQDLVLTSILKKMDVSTYEAVLASAEEGFDYEAYVGTLENEGVGLAPLHNFEDKVDPALMEEVDALRQAIIDGEVTVTSYLSE
ncbi:BMP family lipoprotein [Cellulomonas fimi]|uniref:Basic membrane lipoprotein n=1 Tax=Cellulomonas fimi (strain ATCC 484 / DSM 20113 / JCM 1341 / CCUG 24087 / LMG 16345 / NBRC 15513 / NCIMB 8980 / NCTC 7547 / NRS-133) TaxID=590998 RepID=F4H826_CELFA|nr:BMP family ABC transporter substrate-binding protein [Cellulomonas fimi]AEE46987.1 basic membrane lipoprotein [Cellulomonas fimi ATCC 484]NNH07520.1 BMP family ABC transporter substrate-binding protein [Cellulomonas fimi]VEH34773.1 Purine nucleoside receptor A [Cellulomonas fimi]